MSFRVYIAAVDGGAFEATQTESPRVARCAFRELLERGDLIGQRYVAVLERDGAPLYASKYDAQLGAGRMHPEAPVDVYAAADSARQLATWSPAYVA